MKISLLFVYLLIPSLCWAPPTSNKPPLRIQENDGAPACYPWRLDVSNTSLTCNADGTADLVTGAGSGGSPSLPLPAGATNYVNVTSTLQSGATFYVSSGTVKGPLKVTAATYGGMQFTPGAFGQNPTMTYVDGAAALCFGGTVVNPDSCYQDYSFPYNTGLGLGVAYNGTDWGVLLTSSTASGGGGSIGLGIGGGLYQGFYGNTAAASSVFWKFPSADASGFWQSNGAGALSIYNLLGGTQTWTGTNTLSSTTFAGNVNISSGVLLSGASGTNGQVLTSGGAGTIPTWTTVSGAGGGVVVPSTFTWPSITVSTVTVSSMSISTSIDLPLANYSVTFGGVPGLGMNATYDVFFGSSAGPASGPGTGAVCIGTNACDSLASDVGGSIAIGLNAMQSSQTGDENVAIGDNALRNYNRNGPYGMVAVGGGALQGYNANVVGAVAIGYNALYTGNTVGYNTCVGYYCGNLITGSRNTAMGWGVLQSASSADYNVAIGMQSSENLTTGDRNTTIGTYSGWNGASVGIGSGADNVYIGYQAYPSANNMSNVTLVGANAIASAANVTVVGEGAYATGAGAAAFGYLANSTVPNQIVIGTSDNFTVFPGSVNVTASGGLGVSYQVAAGSITGAGLATCGDATHALAYTSTTGQFSCQEITVAPGSGDNLGNGIGSYGIATTTGGFTGSGGVNVTYGLTIGSVTVNDLVASQMIRTDANKKLISSATLTTTELAGVLQAAQFPALTGDVTTSAGNLATTVAAVQSNFRTFTSSLTVSHAAGLSVATEVKASSVTVSDTLTIPNGTGPTIDAVGEIGVDTTNGQLLVHDGVDAQVVGSSTRAFAVSISSGTGWNSLAIPLAVPIYKDATITKVQAASLPEGTTVLYQLSERTLTEINAAGTDVFDMAYSSAMARGVTETAISNNTVAADSWLVFKTPASGAGSGTPDSIVLKIFYREDRK